MSEILDLKVSSLENFEPASILTRGIAFTVDGFLFWGMNEVSNFMIVEDLFEISQFIFFLLFVLYKPVMEYVFQGTLGKLVLGIRVVGYSGRITLGQSFVRSLPFYLNGLYGAIFYLGTFFSLYFDLGFPPEYVTYGFQTLMLLSCFYSFTNEKRQAGHDLFAKTYVVEKV